MCVRTNMNAWYSIPFEWHSDKTNEEGNERKIIFKAKANVNVIRVK